MLGEWHDYQVPMIVSYQSSTLNLASSSLCAIHSSSRPLGWSHTQNNRIIKCTHLPYFYVKVSVSCCTDTFMAILNKCVYGEVRGATAGCLLSLCPSQPPEGLP